MSPKEARRKLFMHVECDDRAAGFSGRPRGSQSGDKRRLRGSSVIARPIAVEDKAAMAVMLLIYVLLCVRSFIKARRRRQSA